jgi:hypothetical protein
VSEEMPLPQPVAAYIKATNDHDWDVFLASFTDDAVVTDAGRDFWDRYNQAVERPRNHR